MTNLVGEGRNETLVYILETPAEIARKKGFSDNVHSTETLCTSEEHTVFHWSVIWDQCYWFQQLQLGDWRIFNYSRGHNVHSNHDMQYKNMCGAMTAQMDTAAVHSNGVRPVSSRVGSLERLMCWPEPSAGTRPSWKGSVARSRVVCPASVTVERDRWWKPRIIHDLFMVRRLYTYDVMESGSSYSSCRVRVYKYRGLIDLYGLLADTSSDYVERKFRVDMLISRNSWKLHDVLRDSHHFVRDSLPS
jgi:hypothetical protein